MSPPCPLQVPSMSPPSPSPPPCPSTSPPPSPSWRPTYKSYSHCSKSFRKVYWYVWGWWTKKLISKSRFLVLTWTWPGQFGAEFHFGCVVLCKVHVHLYMKGQEARDLVFLRIIPIKRSNNNEFHIDHWIEKGQWSDEWPCDRYTCDKLKCDLRSWYFLVLYHKTNQTMSLATQSPLFQSNDLHSTTVIPKHLETLFFGFLWKKMNLSKLLYT